MVFIIRSVASGAQRVARTSWARTFCKSPFGWEIPVLVVSVANTLASNVLGIRNLVPDSGAKLFEYENLVPSMICLAIGMLLLWFHYLNNHVSNEL